MKNKNLELLDSFVRYCIEHPQERFWQALRNWCGWSFVYVGEELLDFDGLPARDTFYWEKNETP